MCYILIKHISSPQEEGGSSHGSNLFRQAPGADGVPLSQAGGRSGGGEAVQYVNGITEPGQWKLAILALALNVSEGWLTGLDVPMERTAPAPPNLFPMPGGRQIPLIGTIACGEPILAEEKDGEKAFLPAHMDADFALRCQGDSMIGANIMDGDLVYIKQTSEVQNGGIYAVLIDGMECEATLKHVYLDRIRIIGRAVGFTRTLNH